MADRVRMNTIALATTALGQSPSFWHAGSDLLRSKSLDRNSYNSGDWFNRIDWSGEESTWGSGLPPRPDNEEKWSYMRPLLEDPALKPSAGDIRAAHARADELLAIRFSSPLFRLGSAARIQRDVSFPTSAPGVITMKLADRIVVVFNATPDGVEQEVAGTAGRSFRLHPVQAGGGDPVVKQARFDAGRFSVPARTVAVFVR
jgi:pullulanase/glycogen debranching enzyme